MGKTILIIDDEKKIVDIIAFNLKKEGYSVLSAYDGDAGLEKALSENPDLVILDIMMPKMDGFQVCRKIREKSQVPIIMLTARVEEVDKVLGLELGADDYVEKPFSKNELMARIKTNLRRSENISLSDGGREAMVFGEIVIDLDKFEVRKNDKPVDLSHLEFELIKFLASQNNKVFSREALLENVWGYEHFGDVRTVDVTIRRLRSKIEDNPSKPVYILTKREIGYYFAG